MCNIVVFAEGTKRERERNTANIKYVEDMQREMDCFRLSAVRFALFRSHDFEICVGDFWDTPVRSIKVYARVSVRLLPMLCLYVLKI